MNNTGKDKTMANVYSTIHGISGIDCSPIHQQEKSGQYVRTIYIKQGDSAVELTLFADDKQSLSLNVNANLI